MNTFISLSLFPAADAMHLFLPLYAVSAIPVIIVKDCY